MSRQQSVMQVSGWRLNLVRLSFVLIMIGLLWRLIDIQILNNEFLRDQGDARHLRNVPVVAHRGMILDRHGEPLAISTPVHSVWINPQVTSVDQPHLDKLAKMLDVRLEDIQQKIHNKHII